MGRTAGFKLDLAFDLLTGSTLSQTFTHGTHQDKSLGKYLLNQIKPGDLVVRDMGYFVTESFKLIGEMPAFWLTRTNIKRQTNRGGGCFDPIFHIDSAK